MHARGRTCILACATSASRPCGGPLGKTQDMREKPARGSLTCILACATSASVTGASGCSKYDVPSRLRAGTAANTQSGAACWRLSGLHAWLRCAGGGRFRGRKARNSSAAQRRGLLSASVLHEHGARCDAGGRGARAPGPNLNLPFLLAARPCCLATAVTRPAMANWQVAHAHTPPDVVVVGGGGHQAVPEGAAAPAKQLRQRPPRLVGRRATKESLHGARAQARAGTGERGVRRGDAPRCTRQAAARSGHVAPLLADCRLLPHHRPALALLAAPPPPPLTSLYSFWIQATCECRRSQGCRHSMRLARSGHTHGSWSGNVNCAQEEHAPQVEKACV